MVSFKELKDGEIFILNDEYHMKGSNGLGQQFAINLETANVEEVEQPMMVNPTDLETSAIWE